VYSFFMCLAVLLRLDRYTIVTQLAVCPSLNPRPCVAWEWSYNLLCDPQLHCFSCQDTGPLSTSWYLWISCKCGRCKCAVPHWVQMFVVINSIPMWIRYSPISNPCKLFNQIINLPACFKTADLREVRKWVYDPASMVRNLARACTGWFSAQRVNGRFDWSSLL